MPSADAERAAALLQRSLAIKLRVLGPSHSKVGFCLRSVGILQRKAGDLDGALEGAFIVILCLLCCDYLEVQYSILYFVRIRLTIIYDSLLLTTSVRFGAFNSRIHPRSRPSRGRVHAGLFCDRVVGAGRSRNCTPSIGTCRGHLREKARGRAAP